MKAALKFCALVVGVVALVVGVRVGVPLWQHSQEVPHKCVPGEPIAAKGCYEVIGP